MARQPNTTIRHGLLISALLPIALALPAAAQPAMFEQQAQQTAVSALAAWKQAFQARDAAALAAPYTEDAVLIEPRPGGAMSGKPAMVKNWAAHFPAYVPDPDTLFAVRPISSDAIWGVFGWSGAGAHGTASRGSAILSDRAPQQLGGVRPVGCIDETIDARREP